MMHACPLPESTLNPTPTPDLYKTTECISTFDYIQTEYINMELKQSNLKTKKKRKEKKRKKEKQKEKQKQIQGINNYVFWVKCTWS